ncbi:MAG: hypothetical protein M5U14_09365 [Acidimicrobiia bacterium]|nr:hypothetical protein [Acidimicrobiia bacterium]
MFALQIKLDADKLKDEKAKGDAAKAKRAAKAEQTGKTGKAGPAKGSKS